MLDYNETPDSEKVELQSYFNFDSWQYCSTSKVLLSWAQKEQTDSNKIFFVFTTWFPVFLRTTHVNLSCLQPFGPLSFIFLILVLFSVSFCLFLLSFRFCYSDTWSHKSVTPLSTPLQTNPAYFPWYVSILFFPPWTRTSESRLVYHCF